MWAVVWDVGCVGWGFYGVAELGLSVPRSAPGNAEPQLGASSATSVGVWYVADGLKKIRPVGR
jgi:hypothetical protein